MTGALIAQLIAALLGGAGLQVVITFLRDRRQIKIRDDVSEATRGYTIEVAALATMQKKLDVLQDALDIQHAEIVRWRDENVRLRADSADKDERLRALRQQLWQVEQELQDVRVRCDRLQDMLDAIRAGDGPADK